MLHIGLLILFAISGLGSLLLLLKLRLPTNDEIDRTLEEKNNLSFQPIATKSDKITHPSSATSATLWQEHQRRMQATLHDLRLVAPHPHIPAFDKYGLRGVIFLSAAIAFAYSFSPTSGKFDDIFSFVKREATPALRVDAWVVPPDYTGHAPLYLKTSPQEGDGDITWSVPQNSLVHVQSTGKGSHLLRLAVLRAHKAGQPREMIAVAAGEAENPEAAVKKAFRATVARLVIFYLLTLSLIVAIVPWNQPSEGSPFVAVMQAVNIPFAAGVINFVVLVAALSAMNSMLYITTRMMFSLSRAGHAPRTLGKLSSRGTPLNALALSSSGVAVAAVLKVLYPDNSFTLMMAISMFGAMFTWMMIFVTHWFFRRAWEAAGNPRLSFRMAGFPALTLLGAAAMLAIMITTWFTDVFEMTLIFGIPFLLLLALWYALVFRDKAADAQTESISR